MYHPPDKVNEPLYVITAIFNPVRFKRRWKLYQDFQKHVRESGAILVTVEAAMGEREFALEEFAPATDECANLGQWQSAGPPRVPARAKMPHDRRMQDYIKVRVDDNQEIWLKENLLNIGLQHLPPDAKYIAFVDADIMFCRPDWVSETVHALQHYSVVQMFTTAIELSPIYEPHAMHRGFVFSHVNEVNMPTTEKGQFCGDPYYSGGPSVGRRRGIFTSHWHPGYAWAWRREALDSCGGLIDWAILGAADRHMACAMANRPLSEYIPPGMHERYIEELLKWQQRVQYNINQNIGYIDGSICHFWHGRKVNRQYMHRWQLLVKHGFDPVFDLRKDIRGVFQLTEKKPGLRDDIRRYFRARHEDDIHMPEEDDRILGPAPHN